MHILEDDVCMIMFRGKLLVMHYSLKKVTIVSLFMESNVLGLC